MTLTQFNRLDEMEQLEAIWGKGIRMGVREDEAYHYELIQIDDFFIEVKRDKVHDVVKGLCTFTDTTLLKPYQEKM